MEIETILLRLKASPNIRTKTRIADICGVSVQSLRTWTRVPAEYCIWLEIESDSAVTRYEMRPDVFGTDENHPPVRRAA